MRPLHVCTLSFLCCLVVGCGSDSSARPDPAPDIVQPVLEFARRVRERMLRNEQSVPVLVLSCSVVGHSAAKNFYKLDMPAGVATCFGHSLSPSSKDHQGTLTVASRAPRFLWTAFCEQENELCPRENSTRLGPRREPGGRPERPQPCRRSSARGGGRRGGKYPSSSSGSRGSRSRASVDATG